LKTGNPPPGQVVGRWVPVEKVSQEEIGPQFPWQLQREDPDAGKPHAGMVVEIAVLDEFSCPRIEAFDARPPMNGSIKLGFELTILCEFPAAPVDRLAVVAPNARPHFQPALPVCPPKNLLDELLG
jgi:hypothetical protein